MPSDRCNVVRGLILPLRKWKDGWLEDERKINGYRENKVQGNSRRATERRTKKQTDSEDRDRVRVRDRGKKEWERIKVTTTEA